MSSTPDTCPLCGSSDWRVRYPASKRAAVGGTSELYRCTSHHLGRHGEIARCTSCSLLFNVPRPDRKALLDAYRQVEDPKMEDERSGRVRTFTRSLEQLHGYCRPPGRLLDIGCYTGIFMQTAARAGWRTDGLELSSWASSVARGLRVGAVFECSLEELRRQERRYDVVTMWDVLEHLAEPTEAVRHARGLLKEGGILAFSTHLVSSVAAILLGSRYPFFMPMHVVHFSHRTVRQLLAQEGFQLLAIHPHRRVLRLDYLLEKLMFSLRWKTLGRAAAWLADRTTLGRRHVAIGGLGLVNVIALALAPRVIRHHDPVPAHPQEDGPEAVVDQQQRDVDSVHLG